MDNVIQTENRMLKFKFKYLYLLLLIFGCVFASLVGNQTLCLFLCFLFWGSILLVDLDKSYCLVFFSYPLSGTYDTVGLTHFFNISLIVLFFKLIIMSVYKKKLTKNHILCISFVVLILIYDSTIAMVNNLLTTDYFVNYTIWISVLVVLLTSIYREKISLKKIYLWFYFGYMVGASLCLFNLNLKYGSIFSTPNGYRFLGMLRDPNYYSVCGILLVFIPFTLKIKYKYVFSITAMVVTVLSISKMSILLLLIGWILYLIIYIFNIKRIPLNFKLSNVIVLTFVSLVTFLFFERGIFDIVYEKFVFRLDSYSLTTGRDYLQSYFLHEYFNNIQTFLFGRSLDYNKVYMVEYSGIAGMVSHNTYIDVLMSFGLIGSILYIYTIVIIFKNYNIKGNVTINKVILSILFIISLFALSYLKADGFMLIVLLLLLEFSEMKEED